MQNKTNFKGYTVGADPEMFVRGPDGSFVSAHGMIMGDKKNPRKVRGGALQVDGMALEINVDPAKTRKEFLKNTDIVMRQLQMQLPPGITIAHGVPFAEFSQEMFNMQPPEAVELGCDPDYNGWTGEANPRPDGDAVLFRTAAGHIHLGWDADVKDPYGDKAHFQLCCEMAKHMDYYVGIYSLLWDQDNRRRDLYGRAGAFRAKSYGMEYRVPSTAWLAKPELQAWVFDASIKALEDFFAGDRPADLFDDQAATIINNNQTDWQQRYNFGTDLILPYQQAA